MVVDLDWSRGFIAGHIPGASFAVRAHLAEAFAALPATDAIVFTSSDGVLARLAAAEWNGRTGAGDGAIGRHRGLGRRRVRSGTRRGAMASAREDERLRAREQTGSVEDAMRAYLEWEIDLVNQMATDDDQQFKVLSRWTGSPGWTCRSAVMAGRDPAIFRGIGRGPWQRWSAFHRPSRIPCYKNRHRRISPPSQHVSRRARTACGRNRRSCASDHHPAPRCGSHSRSRRASVMSGQRCNGSSCGNARCTMRRTRVGQSDHPIGQFAHRNFVRIAHIDRAGDAVAGRHQADEPIDQVVDVAERAGLAAVAVQRDVLAAQRLDDEVRHHAAIVRMHPRPVGVEDARHLDARLVLAEIVEEQRLGAALALIVAGARAQRIDVAAVVLGLRMHGRDRHRLRWSRPAGFSRRPASPDPAC